MGSVMNLKAHLKYAKPGSTDAEFALADKDGKASAMVFKLASSSGSSPDIHVELYPPFTGDVQLMRRDSSTKMWQAVAMKTISKSTSVGFSGAAGESEVHPRPQPSSSRLWPKPWSQPPASSLPAQRRNFTLSAQLSEPSQSFRFPPRQTLQSVTLPPNVRLTLSAPGFQDEVILNPTSMSMTLPVMRITYPASYSVAPI